MTEEDNSVTRTGSARKSRAERARAEMGRRNSQNRSTTSIGSSSFTRDGSITPEPSDLTNIAAKRDISNLSTSGNTIRDVSPASRMRMAQSNNEQQPNASSNSYNSRLQERMKHRVMHKNLGSFNEEQSQIHEQTQTSDAISPSSLVSNASSIPNIQTSMSTKTRTFNSLNATAKNAISVDSPLPPLVQRALGDRAYEKRKNAALEVEALVKSLAESARTTNGLANQEHNMISSLILVLSKDFCTSMNSHFRKGGLIGLAATAIGLMQQQLTSKYLDSLIRPVLLCFDDPEPRVRYYACESLYNIIKVARRAILPHYFNMIFEGLTKLVADVDPDVRNGAELLDRLVKDIVTEAEEFAIDDFLPLLQNYIRRTNPHIRQLLVGWITVLDAIPDVSMLDYLPDFLDGLFNMLSDSSMEIRQAADSALSEFLREMRQSSVMEFGPIVNILVFQCHAKEKLNRLTAISWLTELIHHPHSGGDALLLFHSEVLGAILTCIPDVEAEIRKVAERSNSDLLALVRETKQKFELAMLVETLTKDLTVKEDVPTKMAVLKWINMLLEKQRRDMNAYIKTLMPMLLSLLTDNSDSVVLLTVQVLSRISLSEEALRGSATKENVRDEKHFEMVIRSVLMLFKENRRLLETRGSLIVRRLCVLLNAKSVYLTMANIVSSFDLSGDALTLEFVATMVHTLNLILLTASELSNLRQVLEDCFTKDNVSQDSTHISPNVSNVIRSRYHAKNEGAVVFSALFHCWCNNPVSTFSLCLLARAYDLSFSLIKKFSELEVTVGFLMEIDKLIHLIESPVFVHLRLELLDVEAPYHSYLLKSCYGLLMLLPQSVAFRSLNDRLTSVCNLRDNLGIRPSISSSPSTGPIKNEESSVYQAGLEAQELLDRFDEVMLLHKQARDAVQQRVLHSDPITSNGQPRNDSKQGVIVPKKGAVLGR
jgi:vacuole morphology and inheritance protein 14